tara:strand:- start:166 stop:519 length:354 start_codon:yes stop_codon:yes gene_type:complete
MAIRRHVATPEVPSVELDTQSVLLSAIKENVELLTGTRGESDLASMAIVRGDLNVSQVGLQVMGSVNVSNNVTPDALNKTAPLDAFIDLRNDTQQLANDLFETRAALDLLIRNLTGV